MNDIIPTAAVLVLKDDKILLVKHAEGARHITGIYGLPGGGIDDGENAKEAALRELWEETGLKTSLEDLVDFPGNEFFATIERKDGNKNFSWKVFLCRNFTGDLQSSDETYPEWIIAKDLDKLPLLPNVKDAYQNAEKYLESI